MSPPDFTVQIHPLLSSRPRSERGSVLLVAMVFSAVIVIALGSYISLSITSLRLANRTFYDTAAINLAETGVEEAMYAFNQNTSGIPLNTAWYGWSLDGNLAKRSFTNFTFGANTTAKVKVYVENYDGSAATLPRVVSQATVTLPGGEAKLSRTVLVTLRRRSLFATGLVAKNNVSFSGTNASVDSWDSDPDNDASTAPIAYSAAVRHDHGGIGSISVSSTVSVQNADISGIAAVGGPSTSSINVGSQGFVGPFGTPAGTKDPNSVSSDFTANLPPVSKPIGGVPLLSLGATLGAAGTTTTWVAPDLTNPITIYGNVTLVLSAAAGTKAIKFNGLDQITLAAGATLAIYTDGDIQMTGNALTDTNGQPSNFQIWSTNTSVVPADIQIGGNGSYTGVIYAPNADLKLNGNGDIKGAFVGNNVNIVGNAATHYDEALADWGGNNPYGIVKWNELVPADDRAAWINALGF